MPTRLTEPEGKVDQLSADEVAALLLPFETVAQTQIESSGLTVVAHTANPWKPKLGAKGVDLCFRCTSPALKQAVVVFGWDLGQDSWADLFQRVTEGPDHVSLFWREAWYRAIGPRRSPFLAALGFLQRGRPALADTPQLKEVIGQAEAERIKVGVQGLLDKPVDENGTKPDDTLRATRLIDIDWLGEQDPSLAVLKTVGKNGWTNIIRLDRRNILAGTYSPLDSASTLLGLFRAWSKSLYKGGPPAVSYTTLGHVSGRFDAPFQVVVIGSRGSGTAVQPKYAAVDLGDRLLVVTPQQAPGLIYSVLVLGLTALQSKRVPEQVRRRSALKPAQLGADAVAALRDLLGTEKG